MSVCVCVCVSVCVCVCARARTAVCVLDQVRQASAPSACRPQGAAGAPLREKENIGVLCGAGPSLHPPGHHPPSTFSLPTSKNICFFPCPPPQKCTQRFSRGSLNKRCCRKTSFNENVHVPLCQQRTWSITWSLRRSPILMLDATSRSSQALTTSRTQSWRSGTQRTWSLCMRRCRTFTAQRKRMWSKVSGTSDLCCCCSLPRRRGLGCRRPLGSLWTHTTGQATQPSCWLPPTKWKSRVLSPPAAKTMLLSAYTSDSFDRHCLSGMACMLVLW